MKLSFTQLKMLGRRSGGIRLSREDFIFWGVVFVILFIILVIFWDTLVFYQTLLEERGKAVVVSSFEKISEKEIDEVIKILEERERKFKEILAR